MNLNNLYSTSLQYLNNETIKHNEYSEKKSSIDYFIIFTTITAIMSSIGYVYYTYTSDTSNTSDLNQYFGKFFYKILDKGTDLYTYSRLLYKDIYKSYLTADQNQNPDQRYSQKIDKTYLIQGSDIISLDQTFFDNFSWSEIKENPDTRLEMVYNISDRVDNKVETYIKIFPYGTKIYFPIYTNDQLEELSSEWHFWENIEYYLDYVNGEKLNDSNLEHKLWTELEKYAGPGGDFYQKDVDKILKPEWILDHSECFPKHLIKKTDNKSEIHLHNTLGDILKI